MSAQPADRSGTGPLLGVQAAARAEPHGAWGRAFRPFFLALSLYALLAVPLWLAMWLGAAPQPGWLPGPWWHGHEMLFGLVAAAITGFLLTASPVWVGGRALCGAPLAALFALWLAGRLAFAASAWLPVWLVAAVDGVFLPAVAGVVAHTLWGSGQWRNHGVVGIVTVLGLANVAMHAEALGLATGVASRALRFGVDLVVVLVLVIAGRITPAFTRNAFLRDGVARTVRTWPGLEVLAVGSAAALAVAGALAGRGAPTAVLALLAGLAAAARLVGWQAWHTRGDPLLWSLHAGSAWVAGGLLLVAAGDLGAPVPPSAGLHALTAGAMGATILAVMTRVALGHTGRPLVLPRGVVACYALVHVGAALRVASPFAAGDAGRALLVAGGIAWAAAFGLYALRYASILLQPRPDGRPG